MLLLNPPFLFLSVLGFLVQLSFFWRSLQCTRGTKDATWWVTFSSGQLVRNGYPATQDIRWTREVQVLREGGALRVEDTLSQALRWGEGRVSLCSRLLVIPSIKTSPAATLVAQSVTGPPVTGGLPRMTSGTCQLCARSKRRSGSPSVARREAESQRCETVQVKGRHPYLVTRAAVLWGSLHA